MRHCYGANILLLSIILALVSGCGFHLRGHPPLPDILRTLTILPIQPFDPFQRALRLQLRSLGVCIVEPCLEDPVPIRTPTLTIISQNFTERTTAFGPDVQVNRALLQFNVSYRIDDAKGQPLLAPTTIQVQRELMINPNAVLGTEYERNRVQEELYVDATLQLTRQLSEAQHACPTL